MNFDEAILAYVGIGIGIAGFSSIVVTLGHDRLNGAIRGTFTAIWFQCIGIMLFSLVPIFFVSAGYDELEAFTFSSRLFFVYLLIVMPLSTVIAKKIGSEKLPPWTVIVSVQPLLLAVNGWFVESIWLYMMSLFTAVIFAFGNFYFIVNQLWASSREDE